MTPRKLSVAFATFSYGGNGGVSSQHPEVGAWLRTTSWKVRDDERIENVKFFDLADTPITMTRNRSVLIARQLGADVLVMVDSDQRPDLLGGVPFWDSSFKFLYENYDRGPHVVGAPYCGPPPHENVYVFRWCTRESEHPNSSDIQLEQFRREEASERMGIEDVAALPTGLIMFDMRAFELTEPKEPGDKPWFYYEYNDLFESDKAATEDVSATRDMSLIGSVTLGYNPVFCNWDAWAGHWKPKCVGKPSVLTASDVGEKLASAARERLPRNEKVLTLRENGRAKGVLLT